MPLIKASNLLLDTNVWLDYFLAAGPHLASIERLVELRFDGKISLMYAPTTAKDLLYLIPRRLRRLDADGAGKPPSAYAPAAWACIDRLMEIAFASPLSFAECELARMMRSSFDDFEGNLVIASGETAHADYVVTGDKAMLAAFPECCITPERAIEILSIGGIA